jgi:hypothetical protein
MTSTTPSQGITSLTTLGTEHFGLMYQDKILISCIVQSVSMFRLNNRVNCQSVSGFQMILLTSASPCVKHTIVPFPAICSKYR